MVRVMRCAVLVAALVTLFVVSPPGVRVVHATAGCSCSGYVYALDYYPYYYAYEGESFFAITDYNQGDYTACYNYCFYQYAGVGLSLCNQYNLGGGKGFVEPDYDWNYDNLYGSHLWGSSYRLDC
jgi:hypothetical protein